MKINSLLLLLISITLLSCSGDDSSSSDNTTQQDGFYYAENGTSTKIKAASSHASQQYKTIFAKDAQEATVVEINLTALSVDTYPIDNSTNYFSFVKNSQIFSGTAGSLKITQNANGKISGTFSVTSGTGGSGTNTIEGDFSNISIQ